MVSVHFNVGVRVLPVIWYAVTFPQCSVEQRCAALQSLLETERSRVCELGACQEQLERRTRELDTELTTVRAEAEKERDRLTSQAEVRWGHCVYPYPLWAGLFLWMMVSVFPKQL